MAKAPQSAQGGRSKAISIDGQGCQCLRAAEKQSELATTCAYRMVKLCGCWMLSATAPLSALTARWSGPHNVCSTPAARPAHALLAAAWKPAEREAQGQGVTRLDGYKAAGARQGQSWAICTPVADVSDAASATLPKAGALPVPELMHAQAARTPMQMTAFRRRTRRANVSQCCCPPLVCVPPSAS